MVASLPDFKNEVTLLPQNFKYCASEMWRELEITATASTAVTGNLKYHRIKNKK